VLRQLRWHCDGSDNSGLPLCEYVLRKNKNRNLIGDTAYRLEISTRPFNQLRKRHLTDAVVNMSAAMHITYYKVAEVGA
jgi:hypothetical protein